MSRTDSERSCESIATSRDDWTKPPGTTHHWAILAALAALAAWGCSEGAVVGGDAASEATSTVHGSADATDEDEGVVEAGSADAPDGGEAGVDAQAPDASGCSPAAVVWPSDGEGFTYESTGGFTAQPLPDAGCSIISTRYDFSLSAKTVAERSCTQTGIVARQILLTDVQVGDLVAKVGSLRTDCPTNGCGADLGSIVLTVRSPGATVAYNSDFYAGCAGSQLAPPFVAYQSLITLENLIYGIVADACSPEGGGPDAGVCAAVTGDAGP